MKLQSPLMTLCLAVLYNSSCIRHSGRLWPSPEHPIEYTTKHTQLSVELSFTAALPTQPEAVKVLRSVRSINLPSLLHWRESLNIIDQHSAYRSWICCPRMLLPENVGTLNWIWHPGDGWAADIRFTSLLWPNEPFAEIWWSVVLTSLRFTSHDHFQIQGEDQRLGKEELDLAVVKLCEIMARVYIRWNFIRSHCPLVQRSNFLFIGSFARRVDQRCIYLSDSAQQ